MWWITIKVGGKERVRIKNQFILIFIIREFGRLERFEVCNN
jgi:hypothetical protein